MVMFQQNTRNMQRFQEVAIYVRWLMAWQC